MNPITYRPKTWNAVVGQDRAVRLLQVILTHGKLLPRGFIFEGPAGVGKTSTAYLTARALMCLTPGSLGCGTCASCKVVDSEGLDGQDVMDFKEVDGAKYSGVENARLIASPDGWGEMPPTIAQRRVTLIDEAHRLSGNAWDVFLKPLEQKIDYSVYIFASSEGTSIPLTVRSRCTRVRFVKLSEETAHGLLMATASREKVPFEVAALKLIAHRSEGNLRNAMEYFGRVATMGKITVETVEAVIDNTLEHMCEALWLALVTKNQKWMAKMVTDLVVSHTPKAIIEAMCLSYSAAVIAPETSVHQYVRETYNNIPATTTFFLKWMAVDTIPADAVQLFAYELMYLSPKTAKLSLPPEATARIQMGGDATLAKMQGPGQQEGLQAAFNATPKELGTTAVDAAKPVSPEELFQ